MFSDILIPVEAMGMALDFTEKGPHLPHRLRSAEDINRLTVPDPIERTGFVMETLKLLKKELQDHSDVALIGFAGAPWTLASYMVEGGVSRHYTFIKTLMHDDPAILHKLLSKLAQTVTHYLNAQIDAGAQAVQLFDTWAGIVDANDYETFILPYQQQIINGLNRQAAPVILYVNGSRGILPMMAKSGADVISVDWLTPIRDAHRTLGEHFALQGNLDPSALFCRPNVLQPIVEAMLRDGGTHGYIFNLGHGLLPSTPVDNVKLVVDTVRNSAHLFEEPPASLGIQEVIG